MKKLLILITALALSSTAFSQEKMGMKKGMKMGKMGQNMDMNKDHIMMMDGKMQMMKKGEKMSMDKDMVLSNGTTVMTDGTMKTKNGETMTMKEGDVIYMNGKMGRMKM